MPMLRIRNKLPAGERAILSIDGANKIETTFWVPDTFRMKIEQYRISTAKKDTAETIGTALTALLLGGKARWGNEMASPFYAVWEGTCQMEEDGEIELWLREDGVEVSFVPWNETVIFEEVESRTGGRDPAKIGRWALISFPPAIFVSGIALFLLLGAGIFNAFGFYQSQEEFLWIPKTIFTIVPAYGLFHIWSGILHPFLPKKGIDWEKRMSRRLAIQITVVTLLVGGAVFEILSLWVFHFEPAMITIFPAAVLLIIHLAGTTDILEQAERSGVRSEAMEKKLKWSRRLRIAACGSFAIIVLAPIIPVLIVKMVTS